MFCLVCQQITTNNDDYLIYIYYLDYNLHVYGDNKKVKCNIYIYIYPSLVIFIFNQKKLMRYVNMRYANINVHVRPQHIEWLSQEQKDIPPLDTNIVCANKYVMANSF